MSDTQLNAFRQLAESMLHGSKADWQWIGAYGSQRMFGITEVRAKDYARRFGGVAQPLTCPCHDSPAARAGTCCRCGRNLAA